jgi:hypothetical protein
MRYKMKVTDAEGQEREEIVNLPGCINKDDVFQVGTSLYKITLLDKRSKTGEGCYSRPVKKDAFRSRR